MLRAVARAIAAPSLAALQLTRQAADCEKSHKEAKNSRSAPKSANELFFDALPRQRALFLIGGIDDLSAKTLIGQLLALEYDRPGVPITLFIMSTGGKVHPGLGIVDVMHLLSSPVHTVCCGHCESMAAVVLASGEPGSRCIMPHSRVMVHQPQSRLGDTKRHADQILSHGQELQRTRETLTEILRKATGQSLERMEALMERDSYLSAQEAVELGVVDRIVDTLAAIEKGVPAAVEGEALQTAE